jgi:hypothetical protein
MDFKQIMNDIDWAEQNEFLKMMNERTFFLKDTSVSSRLYNLWKNADLLDSDQKGDSRKWVKLSFLEYIWLNIVQDLRSFGVPFEAIKSLKNMVLRDIEITTEGAVSEKQLEKIMAELLSAKENCSIEEAEQIMDGIKKENKVESLYQLIRKGMGNNFTELALNLCISAVKKTDSILVIYLVNEIITLEEKTKKDNDADEKTPRLAYYIYNDMFFPKAEERKKIKEIIFSKPHLQLQLSYYITSFIKSHLKRSKEIGWLSEDEANLIALVREGKANTITIKFKNQKAEILEVTNSRHGDIESELINKFSKSEYADVTYKIQGGKVQHFAITKKFRLNG